MSYNVSRLLQEAYGPYYRGKHGADSPDLSQKLMAKRIADHLIASPFLFGDCVLDLGAGKQPVEKQLYMLAGSAAGRGRYADLRGRLAMSHIATLDITATVPKRQAARIPHLLADSTALPLKDNSIDLVVSNHSLDMLRRDGTAFAAGLRGVYHVLRPGGQAMFNYHHAQLFERLCDHYGQTANDSPQAQFYDPELPNPYYSDELSILRDLEQASLQATRIDSETDGTDTWWFVEATKAA